MLRRIGLVFGLVLAGCGNSGGSSDELSNASQLNAENVAAKGDYCCFQNGAVTADSAAACATKASSCVWSETYNDVDAAGRGTICGYRSCR